MIFCWQRPCRARNSGVQMQGTWVGSFAAALALVVFLYAPGFLGLAATRLPRALSAAFAPLLSIALYAVTSIAFGWLGVRCSWWLLFVICLLVASVAFVLLRRYGCGRRERGFLLLSMKRDWLALGLYVAFGVVATLALFVKNLDGPSAFIQQYDNVFHLAVLRSFAETGSWSTLSVSMYGAPGSVSPFEGGAGFYPAGWHMLVAMIVDCLGLDITQGANVVNALFVGVVLPSSMFALMATILPRNERAVYFGALVTIALAAFPWKLLYWGPLFPNMAAYCLLPALLAVFVRLFQTGVARATLVALLVSFVMGCVSVAICQPNAIFTAVAFLAPFVVKKSYEIAKNYCRGNRAIPGLVAGLCSVVIVAIWYGLYVAPPLQGVVQHEWAAGFSKTQSLANVIFLALSDMNAQVALGIAALGGVYLCLLRRQERWIVASYVVLGVIYCASIASDDWWQHFLSGFWYTDPRRTAANLVFCVVPLASVFLAWVSHMVQRAGERYRNGCGGVFAAAVVSAVFLLVVFFPGFELRGYGDIGSAFTQVRDAVSREYTLNNRVLDTEEYDFVERALEITGKDAVVANDLNDGSPFAFGAEGLNVFYRETRGYGGDNEKEASKLVREGLNEVATNEAVREAVRELGIKYVLVLDQGEAAKISPHLFTNDPSLCPGISGITDRTPGFSLVLSEGDMRLYEIDGM